MVDRVSGGGRSTSLILIRGEVTYCGLKSLDMKREGMGVGKEEVRIVVQIEVYIERNR